MKIYCHTPTNEVVDFDVNQDNTIEELKQIIFQKVKIPPEVQVIELNDKKLKNTQDVKTLSKLNFKENEHIRLLYSIEGGCDCGGDICGLGGDCRCTIV